MPDCLDTTISSPQSYPSRNISQCRVQKNTSGAHQNKVDGLLRLQRNCVHKKTRQRQKISTKKIFNFDKKRNLHLNNASHMIGGPLAKQRFSLVSSSPFSPNLSPTDFWFQKKKQRTYGRKKKSADSGQSTGLRRLRNLDLNSTVSCQSK